MSRLWVVLLAIPACMTVVSPNVEAGNAPPSGLPRGAFPASTALDINAQLKGLYEKLCEPRGPMVPAGRAANALVEHLRRLHQLDASIKQLGPGLGDRHIRDETLRNRALAWLHGWAAFSRLAEGIGLPDAADRQRLLGLDQGAALGLLIRIYRQIHLAEESPQPFRMSEESLRQLAANSKAPGVVLDKLRAAPWVDRPFSSEQAFRDELSKTLTTEEMRAFGPAVITYAVDVTTAEPLRRRLANGADLLFLLGYRTPWREEERPRFVGHRFYIPGAAELIGDPADVPKRGQRELISLWGVVNLQLDTWPALASGAATLTPLAEWIGTLGSVEFAPNLATFNKAGLEVPQRAQKIAGLLRFRQRIADGQELDKLLTEIARARPLGKAAMQRCLGELVDAARPTDQGELLYDAAIWLRYLVLLSHQADGRAVADIAAFWREKWGLPGDFELPRPAQRSLRAGAHGRPSFLRWNRWPAEGHSSQVLHDLTAAALAHQHLARVRVRGDRPEILAKALGVFQLELVSHLNPYFADNRALGSGRLVFARGRVPSVSWQPSPGLTDDQPDRAAGLLLRAGRRESPLRLTSPYGKLTDAWKATATPEEQTRLAGDLTEVFALAHSARHLHALLQKGYDTKDPAIISQAFKTLSGFSSPGRYAHALPRQTFKQYYEDLKSAHGRLAEATKDVDALAVTEQELRHRYDQQCRTCELARTELAVARLGREVADRALAISEQFRQIADLDGETVLLQQEAARVFRAARGNQQQTAGLKLAYAARQRDLAAGRVRVLTAASEQADVLVKTAIAELQSLKGQLQELGQQIEDHQKKRVIYVRIKAVVAVLGVVLAPFSGGNSLRAAQAISVGLDIAAARGTEDWGNFAAESAGLKRLPNPVGETVEFAVGEIGKQTEDALSEYKLFLKSSRDDFESFARDVKRLPGALSGSRSKDKVTQTGRAGRILQGILKKAPRKHLAALVAVLASGAAVHCKDGKLILDLKAPQKVALADAEIQAQLLRILRAGGAVFNDAELRRSDLGRRLRSSDLNGAREALAACLGKAIHQCPKEVVGQLGLTYKDVNTAFANAKQKLLDRVKLLPAVQACSLAHLLAAGLTIMEIDGQVMAVDGISGDEGRQISARLKQFREKVASAKVNKLLANLNGQRETLIERARAFARSENEQALRDLATKDIPGIVEEALKHLGELKGEVAAAREVLDDAGLQGTAARYDAEAADLFVEEARLKEAIAARQARRAQLGLDLARQSLERSQLDVAMTGKKVDAQVLRLEVAEAELQYLYLNCLAYGFNPMLSKGDKQGALAAIRPRNSLRNVLTDAAPSATSVATRLQRERMRDDLLGLLQWLHLLDLHKDGWPKKEHLVRVREQPPPSGDDLLKLARQADDLYRESAGKRLDVEFVEVTAGGTDESSPLLRWFNNEKDKETDPWLRQLGPGLQKEALGMFEVGFFTKQPPSITGVADGVHRTWIHRPQNARENSPTAYYMVPGRAEVYVVDDFKAGGHFTFILVPPSNARAHPDSAAASVRTPPQQLHKGKQVPQNPNLPLRKDELRKDLGLKDDLELTGPIGSWRVYLFSTKVNSPSEYRKRFKAATMKGSTVKPVTFKLLVPYLRFDRPE